MKEIRNPKGYLKWGSLSKKNTGIKYVVLAFKVPEPMAEKIKALFNKRIEMFEKKIGKNS